MRCNNVRTVRRAQGKGQTFYRGCPSIIDFRGRGHTLIPESAFSIPLWGTHKEIMLNVELYIRNLTGSICARKGVLAKNFLDGCHDEIISAIWSSYDDWPNINQHHFKFP